MTGMVMGDDVATAIRRLAEVIRDNEDQQMPRLTKLEKEMLHRAAEFVLAGEWPWEGNGSRREDRKEEREQAALQSAANKIAG